MTYHYPPRQSVRLTAPAEEPLSLAEIKLFLRIDGSDEDALLSSLAITAREMAEQFLGKVLITQSWRMSQAYVPGLDVVLTPAPVQAVTKVSLEVNGTPTELDAGDYEVHLPGHVLELAPSMSADKVMVEFTAGYGDAADVPGPVKQGILHCISDLYHHRDGSASPLCPQARALWESYQEVRI